MIRRAVQGWQVGLASALALALAACALGDPADVAVGEVDQAVRVCDATCTPRPHPEPWTPDSYRTCCDADPCPDAAECVEGLCVARCGAGPACVEGEVCFDGACQDKCDTKHPCAAGYTCSSGACAYDPCGLPEAFPHAAASSRLPITVHYRDEAEACTAGQVLDALEDAWDVQTGELGFTPPRPDQGLCGPDAGYDAFVWRTYRAAVGDVIGTDATTWWDDYLSYLIVDPWGPYGGDYLRATVAHEFNHSVQAAYDWWDSDIVFEMTSQFIEDGVAGRSSFAELLGEYQAKPDYAFDHSDGWDGWYMYGSALYLAYLRDGVFGGDPSFVSEMWSRARNPAGKNEPDFEDALEGLLRDRAGLGFLDSMKQFARWRWYTAARDDGRHFAGGGDYPASALVKIERTVAAAPQTLSMAGPMMLGAQFIQVHRAPGDPAELVVRLAGDKKVVWSVQAVPGLTPGSDGEVLDVAGGQARLRFGDLTDRTLIILALPASARDGDPDARTAQRYGYDLTLAIP